MKVTKVALVTLLLLLMLLLRIVLESSLAGAHEGRGRASCCSDTRCSMAPHQDAAILFPALDPVACTPLMQCVCLDTSW